MIGYYAVLALIAVCLLAVITIYVGDNL